MQYSSRTVTLLRPRTVLAVALVLAAPLAAPAQARNPLLEEGKRLYEDLRYDESVQRLSEALLRPDNSEPQQVEIFLFLALDYFVLDRPEQAEAAYRQVLMRSPRHSLDPALAPRVRTFFDGVTQRWVAAGRPVNRELRPPTPAVAIDHLSPPEARRGEPLALRARLSDPGHRVSQVRILFRAGSTGEFHAGTAEGAGEALSATIPADAVRPPIVEYFIEALDAQGEVIGTRGDARAPLRVAVPGAEGGSVFGTWWFWTGTGAVVAGAVVAGVLIANSGGGSRPGHIVVTVQEMH